VCENMLKYIIMYIMWWKKNHIEVETRGLLWSSTEPC
jgi:hypothetical protein